MPMWCRYICTCVSCNVVMLFTCTLVRSHPDSKEGVRCETQPCDKQQDTGLGMAIRCMLGGRDQREAQSKPATRPWRTYSRGAARRWLFKYVQFILCIFVRIIPCALLICPVWYRSRFTLLIAVYFRRLKKNMTPMSLYLNLAPLQTLL